MNRIIKFRAWDKREKKWFPQNEYLEVTSGGNLFFNDFPVKNDYVICFDTGLYDKNGKEIYEGDIIKFSLSSFTTPRCKDVVEYNEHRGMVIIKNRTYTLESTYQKEVIGNIYENPELITSFTEAK